MSVFVGRRPGMYCHLNLLKVIRECNTFLEGVISPMTGLGPEDLNISSLIERAKSDDINEVIFALSSTMEGDTTNFYLYKKLKPFHINVTTLSRGVAVGTELHYADELTLGRSILQRLPFDSTFHK